jgi:predicted permease
VNLSLDTLISDLRYSLRMLRKTKGLTFVAIVSLAVGIGTNAAVFSLVNSLLLRPRPVANPEQLVELYVGDRSSPYESASYPSYLELRERNGVLSGLAAYSPAWQFTLNHRSDVQQVWGEVVSANYFDVLGVEPHLGRMFLPEEDGVPGGSPVVVLGYGLWQRRFNGDAGVIGRSVTINNQPLTVIGVAPPRYTGMLAGLSSELWVPSMAMPLLEPGRDDGLLTNRGSRWVTMVGRLAPNRDFEVARSRFSLLTTQMQASHPEEWRSQDERGVRELFVTVLPERATRVHPSMRAPAYALTALLFVIVDLVLVIACLNLASMFFARAVARRREITVRLALGAGRMRIIRQLLTETVLLSLIAGAIGTVLALWGLDALMASLPTLPEGIRLALDIRPDWKVLAFSIVFATLTGLLFGLAPALHASGGTISAALKEEGGSTARHRRSRIRTSLVVAQIACSLLLLIGAGLVLRSLEKVRPTRLGFASRNYLVASLALDPSTYDRSTSQQFYQQVSGDLATVPGVRTVSLVEGMPGGFMSRSRRSTEIEGYTPGQGEDLEIDASIVGPRYFTNMGVPLAAGRDFDERDREGSPCVAIINVAFAERYLGGTGGALGKRITGEGPDDGPAPYCTIVGVIRDTEWQSLNRTVRPFYALPLLQSDERRMTLILETAGAPGGVTSAVRQVIRRLDPALPVADVQPLQAYFDTALYPFRLFGFLLAGCGILALFLAIVGVYGTVSYSVAQRQREVGIRMAVGAARRDILRLVIGEGMRQVGFGLAIGLLLSLVLTRVLTSLPLDMELLFGVSATDAITFAGVTVLLSLVALGACYVPARRATRVDPMVTLRDS